MIIGETFDETYGAYEGKSETGNVFIGGTFDEANEGISGGNVFIGGISNERNRLDISERGM